MAVFVLDKRKKPLMPCSEKRAGLVQGIHYRFCTLIQRADGYGSSWDKIATTQGDAGTGAACAAALSLPGLNAGVSRANG